MKLAALTLSLGLVLPALALAQDAGLSQAPVATRLFNRKPNALMVAVVADLKPGTALDIGMGQGRNTLYLASKGWEVTGVDISDEGIRKATEEAKRLSLKITTVHQNVDEFDYGTERWDLVVATYIASIVTRNAEKIVQSLKPGGVLLIEGFHSDHIPEFTFVGYSTNELLRVFDRLRIRRYEDLRAPADWAKQESPIVRFVAKKER